MAISSTRPKARTSSYIATFVVPFAEVSNANLLGLLCALTKPDTSSKTIVTRSKPSAYPSTLRAKRSEVKQLVASEMTTQATMKETCEKCGAKEVRYSEQQLRGADEGSTIFYECDCGHKYAVRKMPVCCC